MWHFVEPHPPRVNFTNILRAAFTRVDPKSAKKMLNLTVFFALLGSVRVKAACRMLVKLTPRVSRINLMAPNKDNFVPGMDTRREPKQG